MRGSRSSCVRVFSPLFSMNPGAKTSVAIGMGSNLGDALASLRFGLRALRRCLDGVDVSAVYETAPVDMAEQPAFLNACCTGRTALTPRQLLSELQHIERLAGRTRDGPRYGPRSLDLDLLLYGNRVIDEPDLVVPHTRLRERAFVLIPLWDVAADWRVPAREEQPERTVRELAAAVPSDGVVRTSLRLGENG